jgi:L-alanine-DL-glutamate epimerase-like enolase superfamily enzyme
MFESGLRKDLLVREPPVQDGVIAIPSEPGLGVEIDPTALAHYAVGELTR